MKNVIPSGPQDALENAIDRLMKRGQQLNGHLDEELNNAALQYRRPSKNYRCSRYESNSTFQSSRIATVTETPQPTPPVPIQEVSYMSTIPSLATSITKTDRTMSFNKGNSTMVSQTKVKRTSKKSKRTDGSVSSQSGKNKSRSKSGTRAKKGTKNQEAGQVIGPNPLSCRLIENGVLKERPAEVTLVRLPDAWLGVTYRLRNDAGKLIVDLQTEIRGQQVRNTIINGKPV